jgi:hypothetical protein
MAHRVTILFLSLSLLASACQKTAESEPVDTVRPGTGGSAPPTRSGGNAGTSSGSGGMASASTGGSGGATAGTGGTGASPGTGGMGTGGTAETGGAGGGAPDAPVDSPVSGTGGSAGAPSSDAGGVDGFLGGEPVADKPHVWLCPKAWGQKECCELLCKCLGVHCADSPQDKGRIPTCMSTCMGVPLMRARCMVYHCFESKNPKFPMHHDSHCGHATNRVGGGGCGPVEAQK